MLRVVQEEVVVGAEEEAEALRKHRKKKQPVVSLRVMCLVLPLCFYYLQPALVCRHQTQGVKGRRRRENAP